MLDFIAYSVDIVRMKFLVLFSLLTLVGCASSGSLVRKPKTGRARLTFYWKGEDRYGSRTASGVKARRGRTIAAERSFPFGTKIIFPALRKLFQGPAIVEDRGRSVQSRKASHRTVPVFDLYCESRSEARRLSSILPEYVEYQIQ